MNSEVSEKEAEDLYKKIKSAADSGGYILNPDNSFTLALIEGLIVNEKRYGYQACPCRLASGTKNEDLDIICPCDYRDQDINEFGACYCALFVNRAIADGKQKLLPVPERRNPDKKDSSTETVSASNLKYPIWRCTVCGYICARTNPPEICPICKVPKERFEIFMK
ncbi:MAG TPA: ferredoxin-thioredoxin reductase catalytic domain-containing protein [Spirochaetota bacterium]|jgi:ferredoxin-thioredoxin reductase catalytic subunit/rubredoxin|nr:ferredoxin-thioredoxin reductase catalytic domain-containing protein [Spirochaetota bacterium]HPM33956.1 ferredoxin-thioredoxin reductase catalytic domain-containing protein [Spirochaetota bacterium]HPW50812.1 ferredoxin-thioredoxin reductase catalytic domain-containing protein [Spirochaetota bacterium]